MYTTAAIKFLTKGFQIGPGTTLKPLWKCDLGLVIPGRHRPPCPPCPHFLRLTQELWAPKLFVTEDPFFGKDLFGNNRNCIEILNPVIYLCLQAALHWEYEIRRVQSLRAPSRGPIWSKVTAVLSRWLSPRSQRQEPVVSSRSRCVFLPKLMSETLRQRSKFSCWSFRTSFVHSLLASEGLMDNLFAGRSPRIIAFAPCVFTFAEAFQFNIPVSKPCRLITTPPPYIGVLEPSSIREKKTSETRWLEVRTGHAYDVRTSFAVSFRPCLGNVLQVRHVLWQSVTKPSHVRAVHHQFHVQFQGPKWQASRGDSSAKTSCPEKLQQELAAVTRVPECIDFNGRNNSSLWGRRRNAKSPTRTAKVWQGLSQPSCEPGMCCSNLWARLARQLVEIFGYVIYNEKFMIGMCVIRSGLE